METEHFLKVPVGYDLVLPEAGTGDSETAMDKYTASIELSNACRQFYKSRVEAAHCIKTRWARNQTSSAPANDNDRPASTATTTTTTDNRPRRQRNSIDEAMDKLRTEMTSLMEQDLSLMRQLLTLNETIEELKWQRRYYRSGPRSHHQHHRRNDDCCSSYDDLSHSDCSISDTEMYDSEDDLRAATPLSHSVHGSSSTTTTTTSSSSNTTIINSAAATSSANRNNDATSTSAGSTTCKSSSPVTGMAVTPPSSPSSSSSSSSSCSCRSSTNVIPTTSSASTSATDKQKVPAVKVYRSERNSFDSGIHEHSSEEEGAVV